MKRFKNRFPDLWHWLVLWSSCFIAIVGGNLLLDVLRGWGL